MPLATSGPVSPAGYLTTIGGDDYRAADHRAPAWIDAHGEWPDLTAAVVFLIAGAFSASGSVTIDGSTTPAAQTVSVDLIGADQPEPGEYDYLVRAQLAGGSRVTLTHGRWAVAAADGRQGMTRPTAADIRAWAPPDLQWSKLGFAAPASGSADPLEKRVDWAIGYVENTTWRPLITIKPPGGAQPLPPSPVLGGGDPLAHMQDTAVDLRPVAEQALVMRVVQMIAQQSKGYISAAVLNDFVQSFTAGSYSETRSAAQTVVRSRGSVENPLVNSWRELSDLLYMLMTPDAYAYWRYRLTGIAPPAGGFIEQNWGPLGGGRGPAYPAAWGQGLDATVPPFPFGGF